MSAYINSILDKITFPITRDKLKSIKDEYNTIAINQHIDDIINKLTFDIIQRAISSSTSFEIVRVIDYMFRDSPHPIQLDYNKYFNIIIYRIKEKFPDTMVMIYPSEKVSSNTRVNFEWS
jgi:hypothetical protein